MIEKITANNLRALIAAMVEKSRSGHPGGAMGGAEYVSTLFLNFMNYDPENPTWFARDRFFLDPGHMSPMLYSILALTGRYTMEELQQFRQWGSVTPGHPELDPERGVENTSGPLGQGHAMAVGAAIAERFLAARFGEVVAHKTYAYISDGGVQEEISQGAGRIAGLLGLSNLIMFYDSNDVQLSTKVHEVSREDTAMKYRSWNWNVIEADGTDPVSLAEALRAANEEKERPTLIIGHTVMASGVVRPDGSSLEGAVSTHGQPLSAAGADVDETIRAMGGDPKDPFRIFPEVEKAFAVRREALKEYAAKRNAEYRKWAEENPSDATLLETWLSGKAPVLDYSQVELKPGMASRNASAAVLGFLADHVGNMIVSSADLANSDKTDGFLKKTHALAKGDFTGAFLQAGVSELTMAALMNGIVLHGGLIAACGTFFVFSDYIKPVLRMSALMELPVKYIFSHDAFRVGEDGPTHEPIEQEAQMRLMERINNFSGRQSVLALRPADGAETVACWEMAMNNTVSPSVLILSRQNLEDLPAESGDRRREAAKAVRGGYTVVSAKGPQLVLIANGSEVALLCHVAERLAEKGVRASVVSMPGVGLFMRQDKEYRDSVLPEGVARFALSAGLPDTFYPVMRGASRWEAVGMERFGASAPYKVLDEKFGYTVDAVLAKVEEFLA